MELNFTIAEPQIVSTVEGSAFGVLPENADNTEPLRRAFDYLAEHPGTRLRLARATYRFATPERIVIRGVTDGCFDGGGAELLFSAKSYFDIVSCTRFEVKNLFVDWDWEGAYRLADMIRVVGKGEGFTEFEHFEVDEVQRRPWQSINQYDPVTLTPGCEDGKEYEINYLTPATRGIEYPGGNHSILRHDGLLDDVEIGEVYCLRYEMYGTNAFVTVASEHITFRDVTVWSVPGMAFIVTGATKYFHFQRCVVAKKPGTNRNISATTDSMHIGNSGGYAIVEDCDFSFAGDDGINIHDNVGLITEKLDGRTFIVQTRLSCVEGDEIGLLRDDILDVGFTARVEKLEKLENRLQKIVFDRELPAECGKNWVTFNTKFSTRNYIFRNNYFHENRARGLLLGASCGLVENNVLYKTQGPAIWTVVDIEPRWSEGTGVHDLTVRGNKFIDCDVNAWASCVYVRTLIPAGDSPAAVFRDITFENNLFENCSSYAISLRSAGNVKLVGNTFRLSASRKNPRPERNAVEIEKSRDIEIRDNVVVKTRYYRGPLTRNRYPHVNKGLLKCTLDREPLTIYADDVTSYRVSGTKVEEDR
ncbi:MAG: right-handed parallel beta-helix repeat-containing protein [Clostridia bacterium]|nr:right-handed parallel beta-helix repeat-containing protein [Clostridia bacterium]